MTGMRQKNLPSFVSCWLPVRSLPSSVCTCACGLANERPAGHLTAVQHSAHTPDKSTQTGLTQMTEQTGRKLCQGVRQRREKSRGRDETQRQQVWLQVVPTLLPTRPSSESKSCVKIQDLVQVQVGFGAQRSMSFF